MRALQERSPGAAFPHVWGPPKNDQEDVVWAEVLTSPTACRWCGFPGGHEAGMRGSSVHTQHAEGGQTATLGRLPRSHTPRDAHGKALVFNT